MKTIKPSKFDHREPVFSYEYGDVFINCQEMARCYGVGHQTIRNCIIGRVSSWDSMHILTVDPSRWDKYNLYFRTPDEWEDLLWDLDRLYPHIREKYNIKSNEQFLTMKHIAVQERKYVIASQIQDIIDVESGLTLIEISRRTEVTPPTVKRYIDQWDRINTDHMFMHGDIEPVELNWEDYDYEIRNR